MSLFLGQVTNVYPGRKVLKQTLNSNLQAQVQSEAYTIDVKMPAGRLDIQGVRVLSPNSGTNVQNGSGFIWMPSIGDWVVCSYLEGHPDYAVCLGAIKHPYYGKISEEGQGYEDCIFHHQSGSWIRMRDLSKFNNPSSSQRSSEIKLHHNSGSEIEMTESSGQNEIKIKHSTGTEIQINSDGEVSITTKGSISLSAKEVNLGETPEQKVVLGDLLKTWLESHTHMGNLGYPTGTPTQPYSNYLSETVKTQK